MVSLCNNWEFNKEWTDDFASGTSPAEAVRLPHTVKEIPLHYAGPDDYETVCGYRRELDIPPEYMGKKIFLQFDGAGHVATVYVNGTELYTHCCGYTAFRVDITEAVRYGEKNTVAVKLDTRESSNVPPFGYVIDYLTYGGLYREVWLDVREQDYIEDLYVTTPQTDEVHVELTAVGGAEPYMCIKDGDEILAEMYSDMATVRLPDICPWSPDNPKLYTCGAALLKDGKVIDSKEVSFGFRTIEFKTDGFYLNGEKTFLRGLNRHQNYPYMGYAAPESLQREDARILKYELQCNAVRTSHYPQSHYFMDECDRLGLLVFTEIPGWQHIGDADWQAQAIENTREMVLQYRNHTSIFLWGVRINESQDNDELYAKTNAVAHELDPSRPTSGVRYLEKSSLLEDVYSFNDFSHSGQNPGVKEKKKVTPDMEKALMITEHNGHMFPTKSYDPWYKRQEQAIRHARVLNDAMADGEHAGCFGWCMFDYPTHKDFGSGDRVCYHGVMDAFRNPKLAADLYASQGDLAPVLNVGSTMDIGDYAAGITGDIWAFTNADSVELYKNGIYVAEFKTEKWNGLPHGPILIDDMIGCMLETVEGYRHGKAESFKKSLTALRKYGVDGMPLIEKLRVAKSMLIYRMNYDKCFKLYGKYVANWGGEATVWKFVAKKNGEEFATVQRCPGSRLHLEVKASSQQLHENDSYDISAVRVMILDDNNNVASYCQIPVKFELSGEAGLVGPEVSTAEGGMTGCYVKTTGKTGTAKLLISTEQTEPVEIEFNIV